MIKRFFLLFMLVLGLFASCSGMIEQPGFVSIFSGADGNITLKNIEQSQDNGITLVFEGEVKNIRAHALRGNSTEELVCNIQEAASGENIQAKTVFKITPIANFEIGEDFKICGQVDSALNQCLDFELPFKAANNNPAELVFSSLKIGSASKPGFIKLLVKKSGNLFGLTLVNAGNSKDRDYVFPPFEAKKGSIIVCYWFLPLDGSEPADGTLVSSNDCEALETGEKAFCFWGRVKKFSPKKTNAVTIKQPYTGELQDAVLFRNPKDEDWGVPEIEQAASEAIDAGVWNPDGEVLNAVQANITPTKILKRISLETIKHNAADWILTK
ncbi:MULTISPECIES: hypothetical protein [unclassified Treponema]|uniref:hypothetical protein n=1 Tax=unclassified Treponema TaxID=2638727 RepID=UPI0020A41994|nr:MULTISPECIES: hypothetical protein [unclassified Treponema]UTC66910.1 hypothetical protein E4O06_13340 [Treponema sp. OMZ 789]UTC69639.1 hypothetical protein E4O01_13480 [Treponema sp. OMZ 790]UTC72353.1 hypothetical protein E4O02_13570 [Treponema sp. OMZ 791]